MKAVIDAHAAWISDEVLAIELVFVGPDVAQTQQKFAIDLDGITAQAAITRIQ